MFYPFCSVEIIADTTVVIIHSSSAIVTVIFKLT